MFVVRRFQTWWKRRWLFEAEKCPKVIVCVSDKDVNINFLFIFNFKIHSFSVFGRHFFKGTIDFKFNNSYFLHSHAHERANWIGEDFWHRVVFKNNSIFSFSNQIIPWYSFLLLSSHSTLLLLSCLQITLPFHNQKISVKFGICFNCGRKMSNFLWKKFWRRKDLRDVYYLFLPIVFLQFTTKKSLCLGREMLKY